MITEIEIQNYKSIDKLRLELGRVNVFIGENGAGKSNILEAIALAAAAAGKLDNEFLASRGIRTTRPEWMRSAFDSACAGIPISIAMRNETDKFLFEIQNENTTYSKWKLSNLVINDGAPAPVRQAGSENAVVGAGLGALFGNMLSPGLGTLIGAIVGGAIGNDSDKARVANAINQFQPVSEYLNQFVIFSPENTSLRHFQREGQIDPLGISGEGLLKLLAFYEAENPKVVLPKIKQGMQLLGWFQDFLVHATDADGRLNIADKYLNEAAPLLDHHSANEGFFFLLFYFALFCSDLTPKFFAVDNIDASLNPKLCENLIRQLVVLAKEHGKQMIMTTHNPAVLDGLNLDDDEQRLFVISRDVDGATQVRRISKPRDTGEPVRLSELFLRGTLGGLPKGF